MTQTATLPQQVADEPAASRSPDWRPQGDDDAAAWPSTQTPSHEIHRTFTLPVTPSLADVIADPTSTTPIGYDTRLSSQHYCGRGSLVGSSPNRDHVVIIPMLCKSWDCPRCGPRKRAAWIRKFELAKPDRELTLTCPKGKFGNAINAAHHMKRAFRKLVKQIRELYGPFEYALVWELTHAGTPHCHILYRGSYIPQRWIATQWHKLGIGYIVHIQSVKNHRLHSAHVCKYLAKDTGQTAAELAPMRIVQCSRHFLSKEDPDKPTAKYPDLVWVYDRQNPTEVLERFLDSPRHLDSLHMPDGSLEIFLDPDPPPSDILPDPTLWAASPWMWPPEDN